MASTAAGATAGTIYGTTAGILWLVGRDTSASRNTSRDAAGAPWLVGHETGRSQYQRKLRCEPRHNPRYQPWHTSLMTGTAAGTTPSVPWLVGHDTSRMTRTYQP